MSIIEANCTNCCKREKFKYLEKNKYECISCNRIMHKCKSNECNNMIERGFFCSKCIGAGLKKGGTLAITAIGAVVVAGGKYVLGRKGLNKG